MISISKRIPVSFPNIFIPRKTTNVSITGMTRSKMIYNASILNGTRKVSRFNNIRRVAIITVRITDSEITLRTSEIGLCFSQLSEYA
jgi:hypothetical protein